MSRSQLGSHNSAGEARKHAWPWGCSLLREGTWTRGSAPRAWTLSGPFPHSLGTSLAAPRLPRRIGPWQSGCRATGCPPPPALPNLDPVQLSKPTPCNPEQVEKHWLFRSVVEFATGSATGSHSWDLCASADRLLLCYSFQDKS